MKGASIKERLTSLRTSSVSNGQKRRAWFLLALFLFLLTVSEPHLLAQNRKKGAVARSQNKKDEAAEQLAKTREEFKSLPPVCALFQTPMVLVHEYESTILPSFYQNSRLEAFQALIR